MWIYMLIGFLAGLFVGILITYIPVEKHQNHSTEFVAALQENIDLRNRVIAGGEGIIRQLHLLSELYEKLPENAEVVEILYDLTLETDATFWILVSETKESDES